MAPGGALGVEDAAASRYGRLRMAATAAGPRVPRRTFEALFNEAAFPVDAALAARLREEGVDPVALQASYPLATLRRTFEVVRAHALGALPEAEGMREVGRRWLAGFKQTAVGFVFRTTAPLFGPDRTLQTLPRYLSTAREDMPLEVHHEAPRRYRLRCLDPEASPHFLAGCLEGVLDASGAKGARVEVLPTATPGLELIVSWE